MSSEYLPEVCPRCGGESRLRVARKTGHQFRSCAAEPPCLEGRWALAWSSQAQWEFMSQEAERERRRERRESGAVPEVAFACRQCDQPIEPGDPFYGPCRFCATGERRPLILETVGGAQARAFAERLGGPPPRRSGAGMLRLLELPG